MGLGTFRPVKEENVLEHHMHSEYYQVTEEAANTINETKKNGGRVICVGTTSCRTGESAADEQGMVQPGCDNTEISFQGAGCTDHEFPSARVHTGNVGIGTCGKRTYPARLRRSNP